MPLGSTRKQNYVVFRITSVVVVVVIAFSAVEEERLIRFQFQFNSACYSP